MRVLIQGAGIIGLSIGWKLIKEGFDVEIYDVGRAGRGASWAAAGMLGPYAEAHFEDDAIVALSEASLALYPEFLRELSYDAGESITFESQGTLVVGIDADDRASLKNEFLNKQKKGFPAHWISVDEARELEPLLSPRITSAMWLPTEWQIDNRRLINALIQALVKRGGVLHEYTSAPEDNGGLTIRATGAKADPRIRPNKGQILTVHAEAPYRLSRVIRSPRIYLAPKKNGSLRIGASSEEVGFDPTLVAGRVRELLEDAREIVPAVDEMAFVEILAAFRPATLNKLPIIEQRDNQILAAGHGRAGILLAPYTAEKVLSLIRRNYGHPLQWEKTNAWGPHESFGIFEKTGDRS